MTFQTSIETCFKRYFDFEGRATRSEYWYFILFGWLAGLALVYADALLFPEREGGVLFLLFSLATLFPSLSAGTRRLHDVGRSGWWQLLWLTLVGGILVLIWQSFPTEPEPNRFDTPAGAPAAI